MSSPPDLAPALRLLAALNELNIKAFSSKTKQSLIFLILNDTVQLVKYDRALLFDTQVLQPKLLGVSGQTSHTVESEKVLDIQRLVEKLIQPTKIQVLTEDLFPDDVELFNKVVGEENGAAILWLPIIFEGELQLGLWLERWSKPTKWEEEEVNMLIHLARGYGAAWQKFRSRIKLPHFSVMTYLIIAIALFCILFLVPVPLRMVAPCEIVPKDPILITAPLNGIVEKMVVKPGDLVETGTTLFLYDKRVPLQELKVAEKQVDIAKSQLTRAMAIGVNDPEALNEAAVWQRQLEKEEAKLDLAEYRASQLEVKAPSNGVASFDNPDDWRGKPVQIGERVMLLTHPDQTKVQIWLSEGDNIPINQDKNIKIFLNIDPATTYYGKLVYVSEFTAVSDKGVTSFGAEAKWVSPPENVKIGVKGTAVLYGRDVTIFYWLARKPWNTLRRLVGF